MRECVSATPLGILEARGRLVRNEFEAPNFCRFSLCRHNGRERVQDAMVGRHIIRHYLYSGYLMPVLNHAFVCSGNTSVGCGNCRFAMGELARRLERRCEGCNHRNCVLLFSFSGFFSGMSRTLVGNVLRGRLASGELVTLARRFISTFNRMNVKLNDRVDRILTLTSTGHLSRCVGRILHVENCKQCVSSNCLVRVSGTGLRRYMGRVGTVYSLLNVALGDGGARVVGLDRNFA